MHYDKGYPFGSVSNLVEKKVRIKPTVFSISSGYGYISSQISLAVHGYATQQTKLLRAHKPYLYSFEFTV
jgi:hypothetical protein